MLDLYSKSAILLYQSTTIASLNGSLINFIEFYDHPILFSVINKNYFSIYIINPYFDVDSFLSDIPDIASNLEAPLYFFQYDLSCLKKYDSSFHVDFFSFFTRNKHLIIEDQRFSDLEDFYSFTLPECYGSFFTNFMYTRFGKTRDPTDIINFVKSIMFSKLVLLFDLVSSYSFYESFMSVNIFSTVIHGYSSIILPERSCVLDIQTLGLEKDSEILMFSLFKGDSFTSYYLNDTTSSGQALFREFITHSLQLFDIIYVFNAQFESIFFPEITKFIDLKFGKYQYWVTARKLVHLPHHHLELDPGSGKNVLTWNRTFKINDNSTWMKLILHRTLVNLLTKVAILSSNENKIPFYDPIMVDLRKVIPTSEFLQQFGEIENNLVKKKICYYPTDLFNSYNFADGQFAEMYLDAMHLQEEEDDE